MDHKDVVLLVQKSQKGLHSEAHNRNVRKESKAKLEEGLVCNNRGDSYALVEFCKQWYVQGVLVAASSFLWFTMGSRSTGMALHAPRACTCGFTYCQVNGVTVCTVYSPQKRIEGAVFLKR